MDRFTRFKTLRALWSRARTLLAWLQAPHAREARLRAQHWQHIQGVERHLRDGVIRSTDDPDIQGRPQGSAPSGQQERVWQAQRDAQRHWYEAQRQQQAQQRRGR